MSKWLRKCLSYFYISIARCPRYQKIDKSEYKMQWMKLKWMNNFHIKCSKYISSLIWIISLVDQSSHLTSGLIILPRAAKWWGFTFYKNNNHISNKKKENHQHCARREGKPIFLGCSSRSSNDPIINIVNGPNPNANYPCSQKLQVQ